MRILLHSLLLVHLFSVSAFADSNDALDDLLRRMQTGEASDNVLFLNDADRRIAFAHTDKAAPTRALPASENPYPLSTNVDEGLNQLTYLVEGQTYTVSDLLLQKPLMGMAVVKGDTIRLEHYAPDHQPDSRWVSFSVTKSFTSTLIGAAIKDGYISSLDDTIATYLPRLRGTDYGGVTIRHMLQMASGIAWNEDYEDPDSDVAKAGILQGTALTDYLGKLKRAHAPGEVFNYNTAESNLAGEVLRAAIGNNAASYMNRKIWQAFGMEHDATWLLTEPYGQETGGCCISASLRDYARLGIFVKRGGKLLSGESMLPDGWMDAATTPSKGYAGYGYKWWLLEDGAYTASGIFGQMIYVDPKRDVVIAVHSNAPAAVGTEYHKHYRAAAAAIAKSFDGK